MLDKIALTKENTYKFTIKMFLCIFSLQFFAKKFISIYSMQHIGDYPTEYEGI